MMPILNGRSCISMRHLSACAPAAHPTSSSTPSGIYWNNLRAIDAQLATIESVQTTAPAGGVIPETLLADDRLGGLSDISAAPAAQYVARVGPFRHAVRMSLVLCAGYAFIQFTGLQHGYWILLTSLFVCQPNYNATRHRLALRIIGTLVGVAIGLPVLLLVPLLKGNCC